MEVLEMKLQYMASECVPTCEVVDLSLHTTLHRVTDRLPNFSVMSG